MVPNIGDIYEVYIYICPIYVLETVSLFLNELCSARCSSTSSPKMSAR